MTQADLNNCTALEAEDARAQLARAISANVKLAGNAEFAQLQQDWERIITRECKMFLLPDEAPDMYGTMAPMLYYSCITARTRERYNALKHIVCGPITCEEKDGFGDWIEY